MVKVKIFWDGTVVRSVFTSVLEDGGSSLLKHKCLFTKQCGIVCQKIKFSLTGLLACCFVTDIVHFDNRLVPVLLSSAPLTRLVLICQRNLYLQKRPEQLLKMIWSQIRL
jgi:hypothetical protein